MAVSEEVRGNTYYIIVHINYLSICMYGKYVCL